MFPNEAWKTTSEICKETAKVVFGTKEIDQKPSTSKEVHELSSKQNQNPIETNNKGINLKRKETRSSKI